MIEELPVFPSLVAVIVAVPRATAVTTPLAETAAIVGALDVHAMVRPVNRLLLASLVSADSWSVEPRMILGAGGLTVTVATGTGMTVSDASPLFPSLVAEIFALPAATAVTTPPAETVATLTLSEDHVRIRPVRILLLASNVVAVACVVWPI